MANDQSFIEGLAQNVAGGAIGAGMGLLLEGHNDRRQIRQQQKLTDMQTNANMALAENQRKINMQMWNDTNYGAQMEHLKKAGLNPGLLYGMSGGGATTTGGGGGGSVTGAQAPTGGGEPMGLMMQQIQLGLMQAQKENIQADTANKQADTANKPLQGKNIEASTASIIQGVTNQKTQEALMQAQKLATEISTENTQTQTKLIEDQIQIMDRDVEIANATKEDKINLIKQTAINSGIQAELMKMGIKVDQAQIQKIAADIAQGWQGLSNQEKQIKMNQQMTDLNIQYAPIDRIIKGVDGVVNAVSQIKRTGTTPRLQSSTYHNQDGSINERTYK